MSRVRVTPEAYHRIKSMLAYGAHYRAIAEAVGYSKATVQNVANGKLDTVLIKRRSVAEILGPKRRGGPDPTPDEIAEACLLIRKARWEDGDVAPWEPPVVAMPLGALRL